MEPSCEVIILDSLYEVRFVVDRVAVVDLVGWQHDAGIKLGFATRWSSSGWSVGQVVVQCQSQVGFATR